MEIRGRVTEPGGSPVQGVNVVASAGELADDAMNWLHATTDEDGAFRLRIAEGQSPERLERLRLEVLDRNLVLLLQTTWDGVAGAAPESSELQLALPEPPAPVPMREKGVGAAVAGIRVAPAETSVALGGYALLGATGHDTHGAPVFAPPVRWEARDAEGRPVPVSETGAFRAVMPGRFTVTATAGGSSGSASITVRDPREASSAALAPSTAVEEDSGPLWNDDNASAAFTFSNRVGIGQFAIASMIRGPWLGELGEPPGEAASVGSANFTFTAPLLDLPGRGTSLRLSLVYNSRLWTRTDNDFVFDIDRGGPPPGGRWDSVAWSASVVRAACSSAQTGPGIPTRWCCWRATRTAG